MARNEPVKELRLVLLGRTGAGKSSAGNTILGLPVFQPPQHDGSDAAAATKECQRHRGEVAGRSVVIVDTPDLFSSNCSLEEAKHHISSFIALSTPAPHAFLLCVPVNRPTDGEETKTLDALERLFGSWATSDFTVVLFTHVDQLDQDQQLEEYLSTQRPDLVELAERCGDRYHVLKARAGREEKEEEDEEERRKAVEELLEKVEQPVEHLSCALYEEAEARVRERQVALVRQRRGGEEAGGQAGSIQEEDVDEEEMEQVREEAERSVGDLTVDIDVIFSSSSLTTAASPPPSFLWGLWEKLTGWIKRLPKMVRREALLGALVGLFVGGPFGGMLGATVGSVATEVGRRNTQKNK